MVSINWTDGCWPTVSRDVHINAQLTLLKCEKWKAPTGDLNLWYALNCSHNRCRQYTFFGSRLPVIPCKLQREQMTYVLFSFQSTFMCMWQTLQFKGDQNTLLPTGDKWSEKTNVHKWTVNVSDFQNTPTWAWKGEWIFLSESYRICLSSFCYLGNRLLKQSDVTLLCKKVGQDWPLLL